MVNLRFWKRLRWLEEFSEVTCNRLTKLEATFNGTEYVIVKRSFFTKLGYTLTEDIMKPKGNTDGCFKTFTIITDEEALIQKGPPPIIRGEDLEINNLCKKRKIKTKRKPKTNG